jgi:hypothetical protein
MKLLKYFTLLCAFMISGCGTLYWNSSNAMKIQKGMTSQEVISAVGKPDQRRFRSNVEEWEYISSDKSTVIIDFVNGKVSSLDTFKQPLFITPSVDNIIVEPQEDPFFNRLYANVKNATWTDDMQKALHENLGDAEISCSECAKLLKLFSFEDDRLKALKYMAPHLSNNQFEVILDCFDLISTHKTAQDILNNIGYQQRANNR